MKIPFYAAMAAAALLPFMSTTHTLAADAALKSDQDKISYSMGVDMGRNLHRQGIDINPDVLVSGLKDGIAGGTTKLTDQEMQTTMQSFISGMRQKMAAKQAEAGQGNAAKGAAYLEENKKKDGWKVTASGLQYKVITTGTGPKPKASDTVVTNYRGTKIDGTEFDSSYKRNQPAEFPVGGVIPGWTEALQLMTVGSKWQLAIPAKLAYGENAPPEIGPNSVLLFDIELLSIKGK